jgi:hypothetical protein
MEDEDEDEDDEDSLSWLEDQDDTQGQQNIVDPDVPDFTPEELSHIMRVDESRIDYGPYYFNR